MAGKLDPAAHAQLQRLLRNGNSNNAGIVSALPTVAVCHGMPPFMGRPRPRWASCAPCPPTGGRDPVARAIARVMAETDGCVAGGFG